MKRSSCHLPIIGPRSQPDLLLCTRFFTVCRIPMIASMTLLVESYAVLSLLCSLVVIVIESEMNVPLKGTIIHDNQWCFSSDRQQQLQLNATMFTGGCISFSKRFKKVDMKCTLQLVQAMPLKVRNAIWFKFICIPNYTDFASNKSSDIGAV